MSNSIELYYMEIVLWVGCVSLLGWVNYQLIRKILIDDINTSSNSGNYLHRYSALITTVSAAILTILFYRLSNKFFLETLSEIASDNIVIYLSTLVFGFILGLVWTGFATKRYHILNSLDDLDSEEYEQKQFHSKNILIFTLAFSFFSLLMASPSMVDEEIPVIRELFLTIFLGSSIRLLFFNTNANISIMHYIYKFFS